LEIKDFCKGSGLTGYFLVKVFLVCQASVRVEKAKLSFSKPVTHDAGFSEEVLI
jgi:hypothetical protein